MIETRFYSKTKGVLVEYFISEQEMKDWIKRHAETKQLEFGYREQNRKWVEIRL